MEEKWTENYDIFGTMGNMPPKWAMRLSEGKEREKRAEKNVWTKSGWKPLKLDQKH